MRYLQVYKGLRSGVQDIAVQLMTYPENMETQLFWAEVGLLKSVSADCNIVQFYGCVPDKSHPMLVCHLSSVNSIPMHLICLQDSWLPFSTYV